MYPLTLKYVDLLSIFSTLSHKLTNTIKQNVLLTYTHTAHMHVHTEEMLKKFPPQNNWIYLWLSNVSNIFATSNMFFCFYFTFEHKLYIQRLKGSKLARRMWNQFSFVLPNTGSSQHGCTAFWLHCSTESVFFQG